MIILFCFVLKITKQNFKRKSDKIKKPKQNNQNKTNKQKNQSNNNKNCQYKRFNIYNFDLRLIQIDQYFPIRTRGSQKLRS